MSNKRYSGQKKVKPRKIASPSSGMKIVKPKRTGDKMIYSPDQLGAHKRHSM